MNMTYCANCKIVPLTWATQRRQFGRRTRGRSRVSRPRKSVSSRLPLPILHLWRVDALVPPWRWRIVQVRRLSLLPGEEER
jgi:hypothetical protein